jgi:hypothetical protein
MDSKSFSVTVNKVNTPPVVAAIPDQTVDPGTTINLAISAVDNDLPPQSLTYAFIAAPPSANLSSSGQFTWTPDISYVASTNGIVLTVADNGVPPLITTQSFTIFVQGNQCTGWMGDVDTNNVAYPVNIFDWMMVGRFLVGQVTPTACQLAKADCFTTVGATGRVGIVSCTGDGLNLFDWVQVSRYAVQWDPAVPLCSGSTPSPAPRLQAVKLQPVGEATRAPSVLTILPSAIESEGTNWVQIALTAQGDEYALSFSLQFDPERLAFVSVRKARGADVPDASTATLDKDIRLISMGYLGIVLSQQDATFVAGSNVVVEVRFRALTADQPLTTPILFADDPQRRLLSPPEPRPLEGTFEDGMATITHGTDSIIQSILKLEDGTTQMRILGPTNSLLLQFSRDLKTWESIDLPTTSAGILDYIHTDVGNSSQIFYRIFVPAQ